MERCYKQYKNSKINHCFIAVDKKVLAGDYLREIIR